MTPQKLYEELKITAEVLTHHFQELTDYIDSFKAALNQLRYAQDLDNVDAANAAQEMLTALKGISIESAVLDSQAQEGIFEFESYIKWMEENT